ncbi:MAG: hypothetical protein FVQ77_13195 [Cytophagales bacterium]|nr:hypothetical protein [Cytophagales bacterium]
MDYKDIFLTPLYLFFIYLIAYLLRNKICGPDKAGIIRKYFIPALTVKIIGAIALGLIYQFYYEGGDTFAYFGWSSAIYHTFIESPLTGLKVIFEDYDSALIDLMKLTKSICYFDASGIFVVKVSALFSLFTFHTYLPVAIFFSIFSFTGLWVLFKTVVKIYPGLHKQLAIAIFFLPSVFFWGSGLLKDSLTLGALGWLIYSFYNFFFDRRQLILSVIILFLSSYILFIIKSYILLSILPALIIWLFLGYKDKIRSKLLRIVSTPVILTMAFFLIVYGTKNLAAETGRFSYEKVIYTAGYQAYHLKKQSMGVASYYAIGEISDMSSIISNTPKAVFIALFRPFLWEVRNPVMLLSALECTYFLLLTISIIWKLGFLKFFQIINKEPYVIAALLFTLIFSVGIGLTSGNFGTLVRYKIPMLPFFLSSLFIIRSYFSPQRH